MKQLTCSECGGDYVWSDTNCPHCDASLGPAQDRTVMGSSGWDEPDITRKMSMPEGVHVVESRPNIHPIETLDDRYTIVEELGHGGMGVVYKAHDSHLDRHVALKVLNPNNESEEKALKHLFHEARAVSTLNHHNIIQIHDISVDCKPPFIVMEYIPGVTIQERIRAGGIDLEKGCDYAGQIADALEAAHAVGIVHRDIKPGNVMVTDRNEIKVLDFGLARFREGQGPVSKLTTQNAGLVLGTVAYMSPEQTDGSVLDHRSDIFSLGILLFEMFFGKNPFMGPHPVATMHNIHFKEPEFPDDADPGLVALLSRALAKDVDQRFQSMSHLKEGFRALQMRDYKALKTKPPKQIGVDKPPPVKLFGTAAVGLILLLLVALVWDRYVDPRLSPTNEPLWSREAGRQVSLTVLPVQIIAGTAQDLALRDGLAESLSSRLAQLEIHRSRFSVISSREVIDRGVTTPAGAYQELGVDLVITTSLQRVGRVVRLVVDLVDTQSLRVLNSRTIDANSDDLLAFQDQVLATVHGLLAVADSSGAGSTVGSRDRRVYGHYLRGKGFLQNYEQEGNAQLALNEFQLALGFDPDYAPAHAGLGHAYLWLWRLRNDPQYMTMAQEHAEKAMALGEDLASSWVAGGMVAKASGQHERAVNFFKRALVLNPVRWEAYNQLGLIYEDLEDWEKARETYETLAAKKPDLWVPYSRLGLLFLERGEYDNAEAQFLKALDLRPDKADLYHGIGVVYRRMGLEEKALEQYQKGLELAPTTELYTNIGATYYLMTRYVEAANAFQKALEMGPSYYEYFIWGNLGDCFRHMKDKDKEALNAYDKAIELLRRRLEVDPDDVSLCLSLAANLAKSGRVDQSRLAIPLIADSRNINHLLKIGMIFEYLGDRKLAISYLEKAFQNGLTHEAIVRDPDTFDLQKDPRYDQLRSPTGDHK